MQSIARVRFSVIRRYPARELLAQWQHARNFSSSHAARRSTPRQGLRVSTVFVTLALLGVGATSIGLFEYFTSFRVWPKELRPDLRAAIKYKRQGDFRASGRYFLSALDIALAFPDPQVKLGPDYRLKISGIEVALGGVLEDLSDLPAAYEAYEDAWKRLQPDIKNDSKITGNERLRAVSIAVKLGELSGRMGNGESEETWLTIGVEELLSQIKSRSGMASTPNHSTQTNAPLSDLPLPGWLTSADVGGVLERLGEYYVRKGKPEYAIPLYLYALSAFIPPVQNRRVSVSPEDRCRGATLMNNLSSLFAISPENIAQAKSWALKAVEMAEKAKDEANGRGKRGEKIEECENVLAAALFNLGMLNERKGDTESARKYFSQALAQSKDAGLKSGVRDAGRALRRIPPNEGPASSSSR